MSTGEFADYEKDIEKVSLNDLEENSNIVPYIEITANDEDVDPEDLERELTLAVEEEEFDTDRSATAEHLGFDSGQPSEEFIMNYMEDPVRAEDLEPEDEELDPQKLLEEAEGAREAEPATNMDKKIYAVSRLADINDIQEFESS